MLDEYISEVVSNIEIESKKIKEDARDSLIKSIVDELQGQQRKLASIDDACIPKNAPKIQKNLCLNRVIAHIEVENDLVSVARSVVPTSPSKSISTDQQIIESVISTGIWRAMQNSHNFLHHQLSRLDIPRDTKSIVEHSTDIQKKMFLTGLGQQMFPLSCKTKSPLPSSIRSDSTLSFLRTQRNDAYPFLDPKTEKKRLGNPSNVHMECLLVLETSRKLREEWKRTESVHESCSTFPI